MRMEKHVNRFARLEIGLALALVTGGVRCMGQTTATGDQQRLTAIALEQQGDVPGAESAWRGFLKTHPNSAEAYAHLAVLEAHQERYAEAVPLYRKAEALDPSIEGVRLNLGL